MDKLKTIRKSFVGFPLSKNKLNDYCYVWRANIVTKTFRSETIFAMLKWQVVHGGLMGHKQKQIFEF